MLIIAIVCFRWPFFSWTTFKLKSAFRKLLPKSLRRGEIPLFGGKLVILKSEKRKLGTIFVAKGRFFENQQILNLACSRRTHDPLHLRLRHAVGDLVVIGQGQLRTGERVAIAAWCQREQCATEQRD